MERGETCSLATRSSLGHWLLVSLIISVCSISVITAVPIARTVVSAGGEENADSMLELYPEPLFPEGTYDSSIPDPESFLRLSGLLWPEARKRWKETAYLTREGLGKGQIILFAGEPHFRAYFNGSGGLLINAILLGPGFGTRQTEPWQTEID